MPVKAAYADGTQKSMANQMGMRPKIELAKPMIHNRETPKTSAIVPHANFGTLNSRFAFSAV